MPKLIIFVESWNNYIFFCLFAVEKKTMGNPYFRFKRFTVWHDRCAMKVGTDGVLLGAWCSVPTTAGARVLDVGCGTGLIALMLAQRTPDTVQVDGVEIDAEAAAQAAENVARSEWRDRITVYPADFTAWAQTTPHRYARIVSNPPYFENSLLPSDVARMTARHADTLTYESLLSAAAALLLPEGRVSLIFPVGAWESVAAAAAGADLHVCRLMRVSGRAGTPPKRIMAEWSLSPAPCTEEEMAVETAPLHFTPEYAALTRDFYLKF